MTTDKTPAQVMRGRFAKFKERYGSDIFERDGWLCRMCDREVSRAKGDAKPTATLDHILPLVDGGNNHWDNLQTLCYGCAKKKTTADDAARKTVFEAARASAVASRMPMVDPIDVKQRLSAAQAATRELQSELSNRDPRNIHGMPMNPFEKNAWRQGVIEQLNLKIEEARELKDWLHDWQRSEKSKPFGTESDEPIVLLKAAQRLLRHWASQKGWNTVTAEEEALINRIQARLALT